MDNAQVYVATREQLLELARELGAAQLVAPVPALPGWTVRDAYAHLTGLCADVLDGRLDGAGSPEWTARQLAERAERSAPEVWAEWSERGPQLDEWLLAKGDDTTMFVAFDVWNHEQDIRAAVGRRGERDDPRIHHLAGPALDAFDRGFRDADVPALRVVGLDGGGRDGGERVLGAGEPHATLRTDDYELLRILFGRRSLAQIGRADWDGDPAAYVHHLHLFDLPTSDLAD